MFKSLTCVFQVWAQILIFSISLLTTSAHASTSKNIVCTITINSSDEADIFKKFLPPSQYQFIELTPKERASSSEDWFERACAAQVQCDILIISGHFVGSFRGSSPYHLSMEMLEKDSCNQNCNGILRHPKEVFLFGCNTLATKEKDWRTQEQYLQALLNEGLPRSIAEAVVDSRYGGVGFSNRVRMERAFTNVPELNGFYSTDLLGSDIKGQLTSYFKRIGNYTTHLQNVSNGVEKKNEALALSLTHHFYESRGSTLNNTEKELTCQLANDSSSVSRRLSTILDLMKNPETYAKYLPTIERFFEDHPPFGFNDPNEISVMGEIKNLDQARKMSIAVMNSYTSMYLKVPLALMNHDLGILSSQELETILAQFVGSPDEQERLDLVELLTSKRKNVTYPVFLSDSTIKLVNDPNPTIRREMVTYFLGIEVDNPNLQRAFINKISDTDLELSNDLIFMQWPSQLSPEAYLDLEKIYQSHSSLITRARAFGLLKGGLCHGDLVAERNVKGALQSPDLLIRAMASTAFLDCEMPVPLEFAGIVKDVQNDTTLQERDDFLAAYKHYVAQSHFTDHPETALETILGIKFE